MHSELGPGPRADLGCNGSVTQRTAEAATPVVLAQVQETGTFPTMAEVERAMILAAYQKSNRRPLEAARLLGIGKTTLYRKLREMGQEAA
jgi:transcriptional regulator of acetoin/glycerol metabolism